MPAERAQRPLKPDGKPMRALRVLRSTMPANPMTEYDVFRATEAAAGRAPADWIAASWHGALRALVARGLAARTGPRGGYQWFITDAGRELLAVADAR